MALRIAAPAVDLIFSYPPLAYQPASVHAWPHSPRAVRGRRRRLDSTTTQPGARPVLLPSIASLMVVGDGDCLSGPCRRVC